MLVTGCSVARNLVYHPDINQGNYFTKSDILNIKIGMTKQQVVYILGTPIIHTVFDQQVWYYVYRQQHGYKKVKQITLILIFNRDGILTKIKNNTTKKY